MDPWTEDRSRTEEEAGTQVPGSSPFRFRLSQSPWHVGRLELHPLPGPTAHSP